jgi:hypothetical protein
MLGINKEIQQLEEGKTYEYLGIDKSEGIQQQQMQASLKKKHTSRLQMVLKYKLNAKNKITITEALACPMAVFCSSLILCFPGTLLGYFLNDFEIVPVASIITGIMFVFYIPHELYFYCKVFIF